MVEPLPASEPAQPLPPLAPPRSVLLWNVIALLLALAAVAGSLGLSLVLGLHACPLCYYQRAFVMGVAAILLLSLLTESRGSAAVSVLAAPLAAAGAGIAGWHVWLEMGGRLECPSGMFDLGTAPQQSLGAHALLLTVLVIAGIHRPALAVSVVVGGLLAVACVVSVAPMKPPPREDYDRPPVVCRPPVEKAYPPPKAPP
jgi:disulfide bond formation protein DsbB